MKILLEYGMKAKKILLCCIIFVVSIFILILASNYIILDTGQSLSEVVGIKIHNYLYAYKYPKPNRPPQLITAKWDDMKQEETHTSFKYHSFKEEEPPVVYMDSGTEYHMANCEIYIERMGKNYRDPKWLTEVIYDYTACNCLPPDIAELYKKALEIMAENNSGSLGIAQ